MYTITTNGNSSKVQVEIMGDLFSGELNGKKIDGSIVKINPYQFHLLYNNRSYNVDVIKINREEKSLVLKLNSVKYTLQLKDKYDDLLKSLGMDALASRKVSEVKAPMPGMVLNILVQEGAEVKKGDALIVLEAMKMENILKSPSDGTIKKVLANKGKAVEKNEVLIQF